ncbi:MAG: YdcF family protein [Terriglobales bacterium]
MTPQTSGSIVNTVVAARASNRPRRHILRGLILAVLAICVATFSVVAASIARQGGMDETRRADAIVVFGAAEYAGRPSPVYRARLDHAFDLFQRGMAPIVITTGGAGADPTFTEGGVGRDYLARRGIPDRNLIAETQGDDTAESAERVSAILRANGLHTVVAVSDAYHIFRIKRLLRRYGVDSYGSPRPNSLPHTFAARITAVLRESASYIFWRLYPSSWPQ